MAQSAISCYRVYRGAGSSAAIDYAAPITTIQPGSAGELITALIPPVPGGWPAGIAWFIAVRAVDFDGIEYCDPEAIIRVQFDDAGKLLGPGPAAVTELAAMPVAGQRCRVTWRYRVSQLSSPVNQFHVFVMPADGATLEQMIAGQPTATVPAGSSDAPHSYTWTSGPLPPGRWRVAVRAVGVDGQAGPARTSVASIRVISVPAVALLLAEVC